MFKKLVDTLNKDRKGAATFEFALTSPYFFALLFLVFGFMMACFSWASFSSLASNLATDLNVRQTGIARAMQMVPNEANYLKNNRINVISGRTQAYIRPNQVIVNSGNASTNNKIKKATLVAMNKNKRQFLFPFTSFNSVKVTVMRPDGIVPSYDEAGGMAARNFASSIIQVNISYNFLPVESFGIGFPGFQMEAASKTVVT